MRQTSASLEQKRDKVRVGLTLAEIKSLLCHRGGGEGLGDAYISFFQYNFCFHVFQVITKL